MSEREQYGELADQLEDRADTLADQNRRLGEHIADVRQEQGRTRPDAATAQTTPDWDDPEEDDDEDEEDDEKDEDEEEDGDE
jgi:hypothetical protein